MVVYCKVPYGGIRKWCRDQGYTELPLDLYDPSSRPLLIVDNRIRAGCHDKYTMDVHETEKHIERAKGGNIYFGLRANAVDYIGSESLVVWSKK